MQKSDLTFHDGKTPYSTIPSNHASFSILEHPKQRILTLRFDGFDTKRHFSNSSEGTGNFGRELNKSPLSRPSIEERGRTMKVECPICGRIGVLQRRGNSTRIIHYQWTNGKRMFTSHKIPNTTNTLNTQNLLVTET
ncbi:MAG: hypothetical protein QW146_00070 [Candidatus Bathyarchaeia archaeon]